MNYRVNPAMENNNLEELLVLYALGELEPDEELTVEEELKKHPELAAQIEKVRRADGLLSDVFAQSDEADQQALAKEAEKPKFVSKPEKSQSRLGRRLAFSVAALALIFVAGALLYPQYVSKDVHVAVTSQETAEDKEDKSASVLSEVESVKQEEQTLEAEEPVVEEAQEESVLEEAQEDAPQFAMDAADEAVLEAEMTDADMAEDDMEILPAAPNFAPVNAAAPAPAAATPMEEDLLDDAPVQLDAAVEPEEAHAQYFMRNALYDIPSQKTADGMAPIKGEVPPMKEELLPEESLGEMAVDQMNKRLEAQRGANAGKKAAFKLNRQGVAADAAPALESYATLRKSVLEENKLPNPESVNVEQWLNYFGVAEPVKAKEQERKGEATDDKDAQFVKAVNQFGALLSSPAPADVKAFEEVLELLNDSVGDDLKRLEFKSIVEKTIDMKKRSE